MGDMGELYRDMRDMRRMERERLGMQCPKCLSGQPLRQATITLPGGMCRAHKPIYRDPRPRLTDEEWNTAMEGTGCRRVTT